MEKKRIGIIGIGGLYGRWFERIFNELGFEVDGSDIKFDADIMTRNREVVANADVVVFTLPIRLAPEVIRSVIPAARPDQLWLGCGCLQQEIVTAMMESAAEVVGLHLTTLPRPDFWRGQTAVIIPARLKQWQEWFQALLQTSGARVKETTSIEHDRQMAVVEGLTHANVLMMANVLKRADVDVEEAMEYMSPVYRLFFSFIGRILRQNPQRFAEVQMMNPTMRRLLEDLETETKNFRALVESGNRKAFDEMFQSAGQHFGQRNLLSSYYLYDEISQLLAERSGLRQVLLVITDDRPGILQRVSSHFGAEGINMTFLHTFRSGNSVCMRIGLDRARSTLEVQRAINAIVEAGLATEAS